MKKISPMLVGLISILLLLSAPAIAQKKILAVVVKGLDNPFFTVLADGCALWNEENPDSEYECVYTGPASSADEAGQLRIVDELIDSGVAGIAISPSNAPAMASLLKARNPPMPIITIDADLRPANRKFRKTYLGTNNYDMGMVMAQYLKWLKPRGGTVCLQLGNIAAYNINRRARGFRETIAAQRGIERLKGEGGWTEIEGCPLFTNDQTDLAVQQMADTLKANPDLNAFILAGGWAQFDVQAYAKLTDPLMDKLRSKKLIIIAADTLPSQLQALRAGRSHIQVGQMPFEMGYRAPSVLIDLIEGRPVEDPLYTGINECTKKTVNICESE